MHTSAPCGCDLEAAAVVTNEQHDASQAMQLILARYAELSAQGEKLRQVLAGGGKVPCAVWTAYNRACLDYIAKSQPVFEQLAQKGVDIDQVVYSGGKPVVDPQVANAYKTLRVTAPLRPPAFGFVASECPGTPTFQGATGWVPVPMGGELGAIDSSILLSFGSSTLLVLSAAGSPLGAAGYSGYKALKAISVWMAGYEQPAEILAAFTTCFDRLVKGGMSPAAASAQCSNAQVAAQQFAQKQAETRAKANEWGFWSWVGVGAALLVVGGGAALYLQRRAKLAAGVARMALGGAEDSLHARIAAALGWSVADTRSMSLHNLRELVRPVSPKLAAEISSVMGRGGHITQTDDERVYNRDLRERIRTKPFRVSRS